MQRRFVYYLSVLVVATTLSVITACNKPPSSASQLALGPHPLTPYQRELVKQIHASGAQVIKQGQVLQIIMPTDIFFRRQNRQLHYRHRVTMNHIAVLVKSYASSYQRPHITISGYTDRVFARQMRRRLSLQYAREVAAYLWDRGVPRRWMHVYGYGAEKPIATNRTPRGSAYNRRVTIRIN